MGTAAQGPLCPAQEAPHPSPGSTVLRASLQARQGSRPEPALCSGLRLGTQDSGMPRPAVRSRCQGLSAPQDRPRGQCAHSRAQGLVEVAQADTLQEQEDVGAASLSPCTLPPQPHRQGLPDVPRPLLALSPGDITWRWGRLCPRPPASSRRPSPAPWLSQSSICPCPAPR